MKNKILSLVCGLALAFSPSDAAAATLKQSSAGARGINVLTLRTNANDGETFTIGANTFELDLNPTNAISTNRNIRIDLSTNGTRASQTVTFTNQVENGDTLTINGRTYTFDTTLTNTDGHVKIGASKAASITNLFAAINNADAGGAVDGTDYAAVTTPHSNVYAASLTTGALVVSARAPGMEGNALAISRAWATNMGFGSATTLTGGAGPNPATDPFLVTNIVRVVNQSNSVRVAAYVINTNQILFTQTYPGTGGHTNGETMAGADFATNGFFGGVIDEPVFPCTIVSRQAQTNEMQLGNAHFVFAFAPRAAIVSIRGTNGVPLAWNGAVTITGNRVTLDNSGSTDWGTNDLLQVLAQ